MKTLAGGIAVAGALAAAILVWREHPADPPFDMRAELVRVAEAQDVWDNPWERGIEKAQALGAELEGERNPARRFQLGREIARQYVSAGKPEVAISLLAQWLERADTSLPAPALQALQADLALAYLRLGEQQNCAGNHSTESCIFPIAGMGLHQRRLGSEQAITLLAALLDAPDLADDDRHAYRWLFNIAHMTLGQYPGAVPQQWRLPEAAFASEGTAPRFTDVAASRGVAHFGRAGGAILDDFTGDGHLDLFLGSWGSRDPLRFFVNDGRGRFADRSDATGLSGITGGLNMIHADYDNDGRLDVLVLRGAWLHERGKLPNSLLRNEGDGRFSDVTQAAGLLSHYPTQTAVWADFNNDGWLDLFIGNELKHEHVAWPAQSKNIELYLNDRQGGFREAGSEAGLAMRGMIKGAAAADVDNDGLVDLYVSVMGGPNALYRNAGVSAGGVPRFVDVTADAGVTQPDMSFACWFFDYDNDGDEDLFVFGYQAELSQIAREALGQPALGERLRLYRNDGQGRFHDVTAVQGLDRLLLAMGANFGDIDNDGWLDFYAGTGSPAFDMLVPNRMFRNNAGMQFQDVTTAAGVGHLQKGHAVAFGDIDHDGDEDLFELIGGAYEGDAFYSVLFDNPGVAGHHWLRLRLEGVQANRAAIGARIAVDLVMQDGMRRTIHRTVSSGGSFGGSSLVQEIGLADAGRIERVEVRWPGSGVRQVFAGPVALDRAYHLREGERALVPLP